MTEKPRLKALRTVVQRVIKSQTMKQRYKALDAFNELNDDGWQTCAVGCFLNDCGINVKQVAACKQSGLGSAVSGLVQPEIKDAGSSFEANVLSKRKVNQLKGLKFLDKLIRAKPCSILKV